MPIRPLDHRKTALVATAVAALVASTVAISPAQAASPIQTTFTITSERTVMLLSTYTPSGGAVAPSPGSTLTSTGTHTVKTHAVTLATYGVLGTSNRISISMSAATTTTPAVSTCNVIGAAPFLVRCNAVGGQIAITNAPPTTFTLGSSAPGGLYPSVTIQQIEGGVLSQYSGARVSSGYRWGTAELPLKFAVPASVTEATIVVSDWLGWHRITFRPATQNEPASVTCSNTDRATFSCNVSPTSVWLAFRDTGN